MLTSLLCRAEAAFRGYVPALFKGEPGVTYSLYISYCECSFFLSFFLAFLFPPAFWFRLAFHPHNFSYTFTSMRRCLHPCLNPLRLYSNLPTCARASRSPRFDALLWPGSRHLSPSKQQRRETGSCRPRDSALSL